MLNPFMKNLGNQSDQIQIGLPTFDLFENMVTKYQKKYQINDPSKANGKSVRKGRKRHGLYRKQLWCKKLGKDIYEPRFVPAFVFGKGPS